MLIVLVLLAHLLQWEWGSISLATLHNLLSLDCLSCDKFKWGALLCCTLCVNNILCFAASLDYLKSKAAELQERLRGGSPIRISSGGRFNCNSSGHGSNSNSSGDSSDEGSNNATLMDINSEGKFKVIYFMSLCIIFIYFIQIELILLVLHCH